MLVLYLLLVLEQQQLGELLFGALNQVDEPPVGSTRPMVAYRRQNGNGKIICMYFGTYFNFCAAIIFIEVEIIMIKSISWLKVGDAVYPVEYSDDMAIVSHISPRTADIIWDDGSVSKITEDNMEDFNKTDENYLVAIKMLLGVLK